MRTRIEMILRAVEGGIKRQAGAESETLRTESVEANREGQKARSGLGRILEDEGGYHAQTVVAWMQLLADHFLAGPSPTRLIDFREPKRNPS